MSGLISPPPEGIALLVAGAGALGARPGASSVHTLGQIGEALLATGAPWRIRRLSAGAGERHAPDRANLKRFVDELTGTADVAVLVLVAAMTSSPDGPALVTGGQHRDYPSEATLPLSWLRGRLRACRAERLLVVLSVHPVDGLAARPAEWLDALGTGRPTDVVAVEPAGEERTLAALLAGLCGEALDPRTGTVTMRSIAEHLARAVPGIALQGSEASETLAVSPPLGGLWTVRASEVHRAAGQPATGEPRDLLGVVLPGRFRIERTLASGSFGTVYQARQLAVQRDVAVKVLHPGIDPTSEDGRLFVQEIQSVGRIDHPNVVRIHQADIAPSGRLFFAMELLVGRDLQQMVDAGETITAARAVALIRQLLAGLGAAHEAGLVHADIKPANAFVVAGRGGERVVLLDFGLARLRPPGRPAESAGGTPAYMAPEQLQEGRVDARSDLFSVALVLVTLLIGWRRRSAEEIVPPLDAIADPALRAVLVRALAEDPAARFQSAGDLADALAGRSPRGATVVPARSPFRHLAPFTEGDRGRLFGRERDVAELSEHALYRRAVVYTAPSGAGKTSLLRAGLVPHLEALGARPVYVACRAGGAAAAASAIHPGATSIGQAIAARRAEGRGRLVVVLDQLETLLSDAEGGSAGSADVVGEVLAPEHGAIDADVSIVLGVREDFLARVLAGARRLDEPVPVVRLGPLTREGAQAAIVRPLAEQRLGIAPDLLDALLGDLAAAARAIAPEMGWGAAAAAYPPHLQLACSVLHDALGPGEATLTLAHYRTLGGFDAIVGEHLDRVLDSELDPAAAAVARDLFLGLVSAANTRALRGEAELVDVVGSRHGAEQVTAVLEALSARGLVVRLRASGGEPSWELVHDSLVPRVLAWVDRRDLARRRAVELVRHHLRRSHPDAPSLLGRAELRELRGHPDAVSELDAEWSRRTGQGGWTPAELVARSRAVVRRRDAALAVGALVALTASAIGWSRYAAERELRDRDMGRFTLELGPFDWDAEHQRPRPVPVAELPHLTWQVREVDPDHPDSPGRAMGEGSLSRGEPTHSADGLTRREHVEARGGPAFLIVTGRGRSGEACPDSVVPLARLPGYSERDRAEVVVRVPVPTCQASSAGMIEIPAGPFVFGGPGEPPIDPSHVAGVAREEVVGLPRFFLDRTEVTNGAFAAFAAMADTTGVATPPELVTGQLPGARDPDHPIAGLTWAEARSYCRFLGKDLPSSAQWQKAMRGALVLPDGTTNPMPRRNLPWGRPVTPVPARLKDTGGVGAAAVGATPGDESPYGVLDLAGNVAEWTVTRAAIEGRPAPAFRTVLGGYWADTTSADLVDYMVENQRVADSRYFALGMRCARR